MTPLEPTYNPLGSPRYPWTPLDLSYTTYNPHDPLLYPLKPILDPLRQHRTKEDPLFYSVKKPQKTPYFH